MSDILAESTNQPSIEEQHDVCNNTETTDDDELIELKEENKPVFVVEDEDEEEVEDKRDDKVDLSKYTVIDGDNLDEDEPLEGQKWAVFSFMSPEGIMNCNVRAFKFRGAFPDEKKAQKHIEMLKQTEKYFGIYMVEAGKWCEFDPPEDHVEQVIAGNKKQQQIIDAQRKARMDKINELAGRHKQKIDKTDRGAKMRMDESKKASAAEDHVNKRRASREQKNTKTSSTAASYNSLINGKSRSQLKREQLQRKLAQKRERESHASSNKQSQKSQNDTSITEKTQIIDKLSSDVEKNKSELAKTNENIDRIRNLMMKK